MRNLICKIAFLAFCFADSGVFLARDSSRREYIIVGSKIQELPSSRKKDTFSDRNSGQRTTYNDSDWARESRSPYKGVSPAPSPVQKKSGGDDVESAMMQLQEQLLRLEKKLEEQEKRIVLVEKQNALLLENNLKLKELVDKKLEVLAKGGKHASKWNLDLKKAFKPSKSAEKDTGKLDILKKINEIRRMIAENFCTKSIAKIDELLSQNPKKHVAELYFWRGMANYQKKSYLEATNDFVESYSRKPGKVLSKFLLHFLSKALRKSGKHGDAKIIEGKLVVDYPDFNMRKEYGVEDIK